MICMLVTPCSKRSWMSVSLGAGHEHALPKHTKFDMLSLATVVQNVPKDKSIALYYQVV